LFTAEIGGDDLLFRVAENALHGAFGGGLHGATDLIVGGLFPEFDGEVDDGDVTGGYAECHAGQLAVELGNDLADSLGCAGRGGNDVLENAAAAAPVFLRGPVDRLL